MPSVWAELDATPTASSPSGPNTTTTASTVDDSPIANPLAPSSFPDLPSLLTITRSPSVSRFAPSSTLLISSPVDHILLTAHFKFTLWPTTSLTLHHGNSTSDPPLAIARPESLNVFRERSTLTISAHDNEWGVSERLDVHERVGSETWTFVFAVKQPGHQGEKLAEKFEWRQSKGAEVRELIGVEGKVAGLKLVRIDGETRVPSSAESHQPLSAEGFGESEPSWTRDGKEIVAVWVDDEMHSFGGNVVAKLRFLGSGSAGTAGNLGKEWRVMALLSALRMRQIRKQRGRGRAA